MQTNEYIFLPETGGIWTWLIIAAISTIVLIFTMYQLSGLGPKKGSKSSPLLFLLSGLFLLIALTIGVFSIYNLTQSQPCIIENGILKKGNHQMTMSSIRKTMIHREGSGVPFQGVGVKRETDNSLIVVDSAGRSIIFSEDIYPIDSILTTIQSLKRKDKQKK